MITFGPVPSRRLGQSLGINNIPPKNCSYNCVYCQVGRTKRMVTKRQRFYDPEDIFKEVKSKVAGAFANGEQIDYLTLVSDGEPTLDINLGTLINKLKSLEKKVALITNNSLLYNDDVRKDIQKADWVSVKIDSVEEGIWHRINRPHGSLRIDDILEGILQFSREYEGKLVTESMLIHGINETMDHCEETAKFIQRLSASVSYISIPTRPPAEKWCEQPDEENLNRAYQIFHSTLGNTELLIGYEGNAFASTGDAVSDLLSITAVHPMRKDAVEALLQKSGTSWASVVKLLYDGILIQTEYNGNLFYTRRLTSPGNNSLLGVRMS